MGWQGNNVFQILIVSGAGGSGLFVYTPSPGKGNLIASIAGAAGTDPFGNTYPAGQNFGHWDATGTLKQHFGVDANGDTYLANTSGLTVIHEHSDDGSIWFYGTSGEGLGNLVASIAPGAGTDLAGNAYQAGITSYLTGFGPFVQHIGDEIALGSSAALTRITGVAQIQVTDALTNAAQPSLQIVGPSTSAGGTPTLAMFGESKDGTALDFAELTSPLIIPRADAFAGRTVPALPAGGEPWNPFSFGGAGWAQAAGRRTSSYRIAAAPSACVQIVGSVVAPAGLVAGQAITTAAPAAYRPTVGNSIIAVNQSTGALVRLVWTAGGVLQYQSGAVAGNTIDIPDGSMISLDAG